jgi:nuclear pore complex protein Nup107
VERFAEVLDAYNPKRATEEDERREMMFELIDLYHGIAKDTVQRLEKTHAKEIRSVARESKNRSNYEAPTSDDDMDIEDSEQGSPYPENQTTLKDLDRWKQETQTWDLLRRLVQLRFPSAKPTTSTPTRKSIHQYSTERNIWEDFLETNELALERRTVLQWLESTANDAREDINDLVQELQRNADRGEITAHGWIHTKAAIKKLKIHNSSSGPLDLAQKSLFNTAGTELLVTQLDPDATTRQQRRLEVQDEHFERSIWLACYEMLRRGWDFDRIRETCEEYTEIWRAVSMSGFPDQRSKEKDISGDVCPSSLWRRMCFTLARNGGGDEYERAVYGLLCGDISSVEPVCESWDDFVFAHYNALLKTQFDSHLQQIRPWSSKSFGTSNVGVFDAVQFHGDPVSAGKRLISNLQSDVRTSSQTMQPMKMLQGVLIANDFSNFIYQQGLALSKFANAKGTSSLIPPNNNQPENEEVTKYIALDDHDSLRVLTHVLLIFMGLGLDLGGIFHETEVENVIVAYISFLRLAGKEELIPLYSSQLSGQRRYAVLCRNLIDVTNHEQRVTQIKLMRELGLDVQEFVGLQARFLLSDYEDTVSGFPASGNFKLFDDTLAAKGSCKSVRKDFFGQDPDKIDRIDMLLIRCLEWYLLVDGLWRQTFTVGTMLYLRFFSKY